MSPSSTSTPAPASTSGTESVAVATTGTPLAIARGAGPNPPVHGQQRDRARCGGQVVGTAEQVVRSGRRDDGGPQRRFDERAIAPATTVRHRRLQAGRHLERARGACGLEPADDEQVRRVSARAGRRACRRRGHDVRLRVEPATDPLVRGVRRSHPATEKSGARRRKRRRVTGHVIRAHQQDHIEQRLCPRLAQRQGGSGDGLGPRRRSGSAQVAAGAFVLGRMQSGHPAGR